jgi:DNA polymerase
MSDSFHDLETFSTTPLKDGTHKYAEAAEIMIWSWAVEDSTIYVWDLVNGELHWQDELSGLWESAPIAVMPIELLSAITDEETLVWFHNGGMFDFVVLDKCRPDIGALIPPERRRDTMVQAFAHALPGALEKLGVALNIHEDQRKIKDGKRLVQLFCKPQNEDFVKKFGTDRASKRTHPVEWQRFIEYAGGDITTMRAAHRKMPMWNYRDKQVALWLLDLKVNSRGFQIDLEMVDAAIRTSDRAKNLLNARTKEATAGVVDSANQRDELLKFILEMHGVELPDMQADTLERRMDDPELPEAVKELIGIRLQTSMNSVAKYKTLKRAVCSDGRLRGGAQFRGAARTGRWGHRLFQHGNMPRPSLPDELIDVGIQAMKDDVAELVVDDVMALCRSAVRKGIVAAPGKKLIVLDYANIEGRYAAWLAHEDWKLEAYREYDTFLLDKHGNKIPGKKPGEFLRKGPDLYVKAYMASFNVDDEALVGFDERQIGKVEELMFQYGGGVGAWITGAATYGIHLDQMTDAVWETLPQWALAEAESFLHWLYEAPLARNEKRLAKRTVSADVARMALDAELLKARLGLSEKVFIACDAIKRLWRKAHPAIASYWKSADDSTPGLEDTFRKAFENPGQTFEARRVKIRRDGGWVRIGMPSGRALCYPSVAINSKGEITYAGFNQYTRQWGRVKSYGGKIFENATQFISCDQLAEPMLELDRAGYDIIFHVHDEIVFEVPDNDTFNLKEASDIMCMSLKWNRGVPLAVAGFETDRYRKD